MKKALALLLTLLFLCGILSGCGKKQPVKLTIKLASTSMSCVTDPEIISADQFLQKAWDAFAAQYKEYDATADIIVFEQTDFESAITSCYETDNAADLLYAGFFNMSSFIHEGHAMPLDDIISDAVRADFDESMWNVASVKGKTYMLPFTNLQNILSYNKDMFRACGLDEYISDKEEIQGWSLEDWEIICATLREKLDSTQYVLPMYAKNNQGDTHNMIQLRAKGSTLFDENGRVNLSTPEGIAALQWFKDNFDKGYNPPNCQDLEIIDCYNLFTEGQLAFGVFNIGLAEAKDQYPFESGYVNFPAANPEGACSTFVNGFMAFDNGDEKREEVAKAFLKFVYENEQWLDYSAGGIPCSKGAAQRHGDEIPMGNMFIANNKYIVDYTMNNPNWLGVRAAFYPHINALLSGEETAEEAAAGLDADCNAAIDAGYANSKLHE